VYTIKQASIRSGVGIPLLRAWERRYGVVRPTRTPAGYRLYDDEAIARLRAMRLLVEAGWSPREAGPRVRSASPDELEQVVGASATAEASAGAAPSEPGRLVDGIVRATATMDPERLESSLDWAFASARFEAVVEDVIFPALKEIGDRWGRGELDVGAEHAASAAVLRRIGSAFLAAASRPDGPTVVVGLPPSSRHEIPALAFATALRRAGLRAIYLGPDVPVESWLTAVRDTGAAAVALGASMQRDADAVALVFAAVGRSSPGVLCAVGGTYADAVAGEGRVLLPDRLADAVEALRRALSPAPGA
jgi:DNA-binding transcriptional MerR regulator/methylmalonyl-CoA mutase cobalamin-binding subunit